MLDQEWALIERVYSVLNGLDSSAQERILLYVLGRIKDQKPILIEDFSHRMNKKIETLR